MLKSATAVRVVTLKIQRDHYNKCNSNGKSGIQAEFTRCAAEPWREQMQLAEWC